MGRSLRVNLQFVVTDMDQPLFPMSQKQNNQIVTGIFSVGVLAVGLH